MGKVKVPPGHTGSNEDAPIVEPHILGSIVHLSPKPVLIFDAAICTQFYEKTPLQCGSCLMPYSPDATELTADYDLCAGCFFTKSSSRHGWGLWTLHTVGSSNLACDECIVSLQGKQCFRPAAGGCQDCFDKGCFVFDDAFRSMMGDVGVFVEPGNYYGKWVSYRAEIIREILTPREVLCIICNDTHTTLTNSYITSYDATGYMHVRDLDNGEFVCEWCRLRACTSCGEYSTVGSDLAKPGLWINPEQFACTACIEVGSTLRDKTDFFPIFKAVRTKANDTSRVHCPGCYARIKDGSLFTRHTAAVPVSTQNETGAPAYSAAALAEHQLPTPPQTPPRQSRLNTVGDGARAADNILRLFNDVMNLSNNF